LFGKPAGGSILKNRSTFAPGMMNNQLMNCADAGCSGLQFPQLHEFLQKYQVIASVIYLLIN